MKKPQTGLLGLHSAVFILGITALFSKFITLSALDITLLRSFFSFLAIALFIFYLKEPFILNTKKDYLTATILGLLLATHWVSFFHAMQVSSVAVGVIALYTYPVITVFLEPLFHGERPHTKDIISAIIVFIGIYLIVPSLSFNNLTTQGIVWGVLSAFLFSLRNIIHGRYFSHYTARHALFYQSLVVVLALLPFAGTHLDQITQWQWGQLLVLGIFFTAVPHTLFAHSLRHLKAKTAGLIACLQVVYATLFSIILLDASLNNSIIIGGTLVVSTAMYESFTTSKKT